MPPERRPFHKLVWVPVGRGALEYGASRVTVGKDELLLVPPGQVHRFTDDPTAPLTLVMAYFSEEIVARSTPLHQLLPALRTRFPDPFPQVKLNSYRRGAVRNTFKRMLAEQPREDACATAMLHAGLLELLVIFFRSEPARKSVAPSREQALEGTLEYIDDLFHTEIRVRDLADMCGISSRRYSYLFKQRTGKTVVQYLNDKRVAYAQERLRETGQIMYAAVAAGFGDAAHFYRVFKRSTGQTPGQYLESYMSQESTPSEGQQHAP